MNILGKMDPLLQLNLASHFPILGLARFHKFTDFSQMAFHCSHTFCKDRSCHRFKIGPKARYHMRNDERHSSLSC